MIRVFNRHGRHVPSIVIEKLVSVRLSISGVIFVDASFIRYKEIMNIHTLETTPAKKRSLEY